MSPSVSPSVSPSASASPTPSASGPNYCGTAASYNDGGTTAWTNPTNAQGDTTGTAATCAVGSNGGTSYELRCTNFSFSLPTGATINGVTVEVECSSANNNRQYVNAVYLLNNAAHIGNNLSDSSAINAKAFKTFGGSTNMWGLNTSTLTQSIINGSTFGVGFKIQRNTSQSTTTSVYRVRITVDYTAM